MDVSAASATPGGLALQTLRTALEDRAAAIETQLVAEVLAQDVPLLGAALTKVQNLQTDVLATLTAAMAAIDAAIAQAEEKLELSGPDPDVDAAAILAEIIKEVEGIDVQFLDTNQLVFQLVLEDRIDAQVELDSKLGIDAGAFLEVGGSAQAEVVFQSTLQVSVDTENAKVQFLNPADTPLATLCVEASADVDADATLGVVDIGFDSDSQTAALSLKFDLTEDDGTFDVSLRDDAVATFDGAFTAGFDLGALPSISADMSMDFALQGGIVDFGDWFSLPDFSLGEIRVDAGAMGDFLDAMFGDILSILDSFPFGEIIDFLTTPVPIINDLGFNIPDVDGITGVTVADLVAFSSDLDINFDFLGVAVDLINLGNLITANNRRAQTDFEIGEINFDGFALGGLLDGSLDLGLGFEALGDLNIDGLSFGDSADLFGDMGTIGGDIRDFSLTGAIEFPMFTNPFDSMIQLLFSGIGGNVDPISLFEVDLPKLGFSEDLSLRANLGPFFIGLFGEFGVQTDFAMGYDSTGLFGDGSFAEGFYIQAQLPDVAGVENPIAQVSFTIGAEGGVDVVVAEAGLRGGIRGDLGIGFSDDGDGLTRLSDLGSCLFDDIGGRLAAVLDAVARIGIGPFSYTFRENFFDVTIATFEGDPCSGGGNQGREMKDTGLATVNKEAGSLRINVGDRAELRGLPDDIDLDEDKNSPAVAENIRISLSRNDDGTIVENEIVVSAFGVFERYDITGVTKIFANYGGHSDILVVDQDVLLPVIANMGSGGSDLDTAIGGGGDDVIAGGRDEDVLLGGDGVDILRGNRGNDTLAGGAEGDLLDGGSGTDTVDYSDSDAGVSITPFDFADIDQLDNAQKELVDGLAPARAMIGAGGSAAGDVLYQIEHLIGSRFDDVLTGNAADENQLDGGDGNDVLNGGNRADLLTGGRGADDLNGGGGSDWASYAFSKAAVAVDLAQGRGAGGDAQGDTFDSIENIVGTGFNDVLIGTGGGNTLHALAGDDWIDGRGGQDEIDAGAGDDTVLGYASGAKLSGGGTVGSNPGADLLTYAHMNPFGQAFVDGAFTAFNSKIDLKTGVAILGAIGQDTLQGAPGLLPDDAAEAYRNSFENVIGTAQKDWILGDNGANTLDGGAEDDLLEGNDGNDILIGGAGADVLKGGTGLDLADYSGSGAGVKVNLTDGTGLLGDAQGDTLEDIEDLLGSEFIDELTGSGARNRIDPGLYGVVGTERVHGGADGDATVVDTLALDYSRAADQEGGFLLTLEDDGTGHATTRAGGREVLTLSSIERLDIVLGEGADAVQSEHLLQSDRVSTGGGADIISVGLGIDFIDAGAGDDTVLRQAKEGLAGRASEGLGNFGFRLDGGAGYDTAALDLSHARNDLGIDLTSAAGQAAFSAGFIAGNGYIVNFEQIGDLATGSGDDSIKLAGALNRTLSLGDGADTLHLLDGNVTVAAGTDDDYLTLGTGRHIIDGGSNPDGQFRDWDTLEIDYSGSDRGISVLVDKNALGEDARTFGLISQREGDTGEFISEGSFRNIERLVITTDVFDDELFGIDLDTGPGRLGDRLSAGDGADLLDGRAGDDTLFGGLGKDTLLGGEGDDILSGGSHGIELGTYDGVAGLYGNGDLMDGGAGNDTYVLGDGLGTHYGIGNVGQNDYARLTLEAGDTIVLAGDAGDYELVDRGVNPQEIHLRSTGQIVAVVTATAEDRLVGLDDARIDYTPLTIFVGAAQAAEIGAASGASVLSATPTPVFDVQALDPLDGSAMAALFGLSSVKLASYTGSAASVGMFTGLFSDDPQGAGLVLSTGRVADLAGPNENAGRITAEAIDQSVEMNFDYLGHGVNVSALPALDGGLQSLLLIDDNNRTGGGPGSFTGIDVDAVFLSTTLLTEEQISDARDLNNDALLDKLDIIRFDMGSLDFTAGTIRYASANTRLHGTENDTVRADLARLDVVDYAGGAGTGFVTFGDGGSLALSLSEAVETDGDPVYLYVVEGGSPERLEGRLTVSAAPIAPEGDLSTDLGRAGTEGDTARLEATLFREEASDGPEDLFQIVIASEELPEFGGSLNSDTFEVTVNGVQALVLSDGRMATMDTLANSPNGLFHDDLILNLPGTGPLADTLRADAYTRVLTVSAPVQAGDNALVIEVADGRDGLLDSALFLLPLKENRIILGTDLDDVLEGTAADDEIRALDGDDLLLLSDGQDLIDGGGGLDTVEFTGDASQIFLGADADRIVLFADVHQTTLSDVEFLAFEDAGGTRHVVELAPFLVHGDMAPVVVDDRIEIPTDRLGPLAALDVLANDISLTGGNFRVVEIATEEFFAPVRDDPASLEGVYGTLTLGPDGMADYTLSEQFADLDQDVEEVFYYRAHDGRDWAEAEIRVHIPSAGDDTPPVVDVDRQQVDRPDPELTGTVDDPEAVVEVSVNGKTALARNNKDGTWTLEAGALPPLDPGRYEIKVTAVDAAGNAAQLSSPDGLNIVPALDNHSAGARYVEQLQQTGMPEDVQIASLGLMQTDSGEFRSVWSITNTHDKALSAEVMTGDMGFYTRLELAAQSETLLLSDVVAPKADGRHFLFVEDGQRDSARAVLKETNDFSSIFKAGADDLHPGRDWNAALSLDANNRSIEKANPGLVREGFSRTVEDSVGLNLITRLTGKDGYLEDRTVGLAFETGKDVADRQVLFEIGGWDNGISAWIENDMFIFSAWGDGAGDWDVASIAMEVDANTRYAATLSFDGAEDFSGVMEGFLNGVSMGTQDKLGVFGTDNNDLGIGRVDGRTRVDDKLLAGREREPFEGFVDKVIIYNSLEDAADGSLLQALLMQDWIA